MRKKYLFEYDMAFMTMLSVVLFIIPSAVVYGFFLMSREKELFFLDKRIIDVITNEFNIYYDIALFIGVIVIFFLWTVLHELIHGFFYKFKGASKNSIYYGMALEKGVFYCRCGDYVYRECVLISLLAPFILIGVVTLVIGMIINSYILIFLSIANISGAAGDISMFFFFLERSDPNMRFREIGDTTSFVVESYEDLTKVKNKGVKFIREVNDYEIPQEGNKRVIISAASYAIIFLVVLLLVALLLLNYLL